jgi:hypothetical protein
MIESMNGGVFLNLTGDLAYKALDKLADNSNSGILQVVVTNRPETLRNEASMS